MEPPNHPAVLVIGEALIDVVMRPGATPEAVPGGSPANVAVGLARLDIPVTLATSFGDDPYGTLIARHLIDNQVRLSAGCQMPGRSSVATAHLDESGAASYEFEIDWDPAPFELPTGAAGVHVGSIATVLEPGASRVAEFLRSLQSEPITITYDPNVRPAITPDPAQVWGQIHELIGLVDVIKLSDEDCGFLSSRDPVDLARQLCGVGRCRLVIVTRGADGAVAVPAGGEPIEVSVAGTIGTVTVADTVGAGDSFMAALIAWLANNDQLGSTRAADLTGRISELLEYASRAAAITVARTGANPPTTTELDAEG